MTRRRGRSARCWPTVKRATSGGGLLPSRRGELLNLAGWFAECRPGARGRAVHGRVRPVLRAQPAAGARTRRRRRADAVARRAGGGRVGQRAQSRRSGRPRSHGSRSWTTRSAGKSLLAQARDAEAKRRAAAAELAAAAEDLDRADVVRGTRCGELCELLTSGDGTAQHPTDSGAAADPVRGLRLTADPDRRPHHPGSQRGRHADARRTRRAGAVVRDGRGSGQRPRHERGAGRPVRDRRGERGALRARAVAAAAVARRWGRTATCCRWCTGTGSRWPTCSPRRWATGWSCSGSSPGCTRRCPGSDLRRGEAALTPCAATRTSR